ncbi:hypothetical protein PENTCL1PPCAC_5184, partial [Pristionchus entomophagus]
VRLLVQQAELLAITEEDCFSELPRDCLLDILARINHDDLDEISTMNERMRRVSEKSRSKSVKIVAEKLVVAQVNPHRFRI